MRRSQSQTSQDLDIRRHETISQLSQHSTVGPLLKALSTLVRDEGTLCEGILEALAQEPDIACMPLGREACRRVEDIVQDLPKSCNDSFKSNLQPSKSCRFADLPGTVEACMSETGDAVAVGSVRSHRSMSCTTLADSEEDDSQHRMPWFPDASHGSLRRRIFALLEDADSSILAKVFAGVIVLCIVLSTVSFVLETLPELRERPAECARLRQAGLPLTVRACEPKPMSWFFPIEATCIIVFTIDYVLRTAFAHTARDKKSKGPLWATLVYCIQPLALVDLVAIVPFYLDLATEGALGFAKVLRLARIMRLFKLAGRFPMVTMYSEVMTMSGQPLMILMFFNSIVVMLFGSLMYYAEGQTFSVDDKFTSDARFPTGVFVRKNQQNTGFDVTPFRSIPYSLWWVCVTVTTVGYGDYAPTTMIGKCIGVSTFYCGIIFLALPISILGQNFSIVYDRFLEKKAASSPSRIDSRVSRRPTALRVSTSSLHVLLPSSGSLARRLFALLEDPTSCKLAKWFSIFMMIAIVVSTSSFVMESMADFKQTPEECSLERLTVEACEPVPHGVFYILEVVCIVIFTLDYVLRICCVHATDPMYCGLDATRSYSRVGQTFAYARQVLNLIDLFAIVPFYVEAAGGGGGGASVLRVLRLVRVFRVLKVPRLRSCAEMFLDVGLDALPALVIMLGMSMLACVFFASCIYFAEGSRYSVSEERFKEAYVEGLYIRPTIDGYGVEQSPFRSIPYSFWWFFTTATTVGYGDDVPTTTAGRLVAVCVFAVGVVLLAMPITIVGGSFGKFYEDWVKSIAEMSRSSTNEELEGRNDDDDEFISMPVTPVRSERQPSPKRCCDTVLPLPAQDLELVATEVDAIEDFIHMTLESPMEAWN